MKKFLIITLLIAGFWAPVTLTAQSNELMDVFFSRSEADLGTSAYLVLAAAGAIEESSSAEDALNWISQSGQLSKLDNLDPDRMITYGEFSYLLMEVFKEKGGLMYRLIPGPRYAAREVAYQNWIIGKSSPERSLKPFEVINALITIMEREKS